MREGNVKMNTGKVTMHLRNAAVLLGSIAALGFGLTAFEKSAEAQEIQITGPLAGAPAVRKLRLHRDGRFEIAPSISFTLLDEYRRTLIPGLRLQYHFTDWFGLGVWGGYGIQYNTGLSDELQQKAVDDRACARNSAQPACRLTAVNLTHNKLADDQLGRIQWIAAPQVSFVPFRGKLALFSALFVDTDVNIFLGAAIVGLQERAECGGAKKCDAQASFTLASRIVPAPTFGLGLNFYPTKFFGSLTGDETTNPGKHKCG